jgi:hypothetical protein
LDGWILWWWHNHSSRHFNHRKASPTTEPRRGLMRKGKTCADTETEGEQTKGSGKTHSTRCPRVSCKSLNRTDLSDLSRFIGEIGESQTSVHVHARVQHSCNCGVCVAGSRNEWAAAHLPPPDPQVQPSLQFTLPVIAGQLNWHCRIPYKNKSSQQSCAPKMRPETVQEEKRNHAEWRSNATETTQCFLA